MGSYPTQFFLREERESRLNLEKIRGFESLLKSVGMATTLSFQFSEN